MESWFYHHAHELLHQKFACIRNLHSANVLWTVARSTIEPVLLQVALTKQPAFGTNMHLVAITHIVQTLLQEPWTSVTNHAVSFHFTESKSTVAWPTFSWLPCQNCSFTSWSRVNFIAHHVLKSLVISWTQEDHHLQLLSSEAIVHGFITISLVASLMKFSRDKIDSLPTKWSRITFVTRQTAKFWQNTLNQVANRHSWRNSVRINNHVWNYAFYRKRKIFLSVSHSACAFLTVTRRKLVANLRSLNGPHFNFDIAFSPVIFCYYHLINVTLLLVLKWNWLVFVWLGCSLLLAILHSSVILNTKRIKRLGRFDSTNDNVVTIHKISWTDDSVVIKFIIRSTFEARCLRAVWIAELLAESSFLRVGSVENWSEKSSVNRWLVQHDRILLVVSRITGNSNDGVAASSQLFEMEVFHTFSGYQRFLRVVKHMRKSVHSHLVVWGVHSHCLLTHSRLIAISWRLVVVWERDDRGTNSKDHSRVNFTVSVGYWLSFSRVQIFQLHRNHCCFFFLNIQKLNKTFLAASFEIPLSTALLLLIFVLTSKDLLDMPLSYSELVVFNDVEWTLNTTWISAKTNLSSAKVS